MRLVGYMLKQPSCHWCLKAIGAGDCEQHGYIGLMRAAQEYDPAKGAFSTLACIWIRNHIYQAAEAERRYRRVPVVAMTDDLEILYEDYPDPGIEHEAAVCKRAAAADDLWEKIRRHLSPKDVEAAELTAACGSQMAACRLLGVSRGTINARLRSIRRRIVELGLIGPLRIDPDRLKLKSGAKRREYMRLWLRRMRKARKAVPE